jgi:hypothetical protein
MKTKNIFLSATIIALAFVACNNQTEENTTETAQDEAVVETPAPVEINGDVYFVNVKDSQDIKLPFIAGKGHHHLLIDKSFDPEGTVVPASETSIHYGKGQTQDTIKTLSKGKHTLTLQFANGAHMSYGEKLSKTITVNVK